MSITVTVKKHWLLFPLLSDAVLVTSVTPTGNTEPLAGTFEILVTKQLSLAFTMKVALLVQVGSNRGADFKDLLLVEFRIAGVGNLLGDGNLPFYGGIEVVQSSC